MSKKFLFAFLCIALTLSLVACAKVQHNYSPNYTKLDFPPHDKEITVYVGDAMLVQGYTVDVTMLVNKDDISGACYAIPQGAYKKIGSDKKNNYFSLKSFDENSISTSSFCDTPDALFVTHKGNEICVATTYGNFTCYPAAFEIKTMRYNLPTKVQQHLIFSGLEGKYAKFMYVERLGTETRFTHTAVYDVSTLPTIGYRGAQIELISCDDESITYKVKKHFADRKALPQNKEEKEEMPAQDVRSVM